MQTRNKTNTRKEQVSQGEVNSGEVITRPDMAVSIREMLANHTRGHELVKNLTEYEDEALRFKDITEIEDQIEEHKALIKEAQEQDEKEAAKKQAAEQAKKAKENEPQQ
jgi:hypothetical protein